MTQALPEEANDLTRLLSGKTVKLTRRHRASELMIEFTDGTCLFVNGDAAGLEFSVTCGKDKAGTAS